MLRSVGSRCLQAAKRSDVAGLVATFFEVLTATLSVADVVADALVAWQFYSDGHTTWAYCVLASLLISSIAYTFFFCDNVLCDDPVFKYYFAKRNRSQRYQQFYSWSWQQKLKTYVVTFLVSQLLPTVVWLVGVLHANDIFFTWIPKPTQSGTVADTAWASLASKDSTTSNFNVDTNVETPPSVRGGGGLQRLAAEEDQIDHSAGPPSGCNAAVEEELQQSRDGASLMRRVHSSMQHHIRTHILFYIETVTEAIPQALIQLLAMTYTATSNDDGPTSLQLFSLGMSLLTICTKAYLVSATFDIHAFVFKAALAVHDLFVLFYVYSTLLAPRHEDSWDFDPLGIGISFGLVSAVWVVRLAIAVGLLLTLVLIICIAVVVEQNFRFSFRDLRGFVAVSALIAVGVIPMLIVADATKLAWIAWLDAVNLPLDEFLPSFAALLSFVRNGRSAEEVHERVMHVSHACAVNDRTLCLEKSAEHSTQQWTTNYWAGKARGCEAVAALTSGKAMASTKPWSIPFVSEDNRTGSIRQWVRSKLNHPQQADRVIIYAAMPVVSFYAATQVLLLFFPIFNVLIEGVAHQNNLQLFCAGVSTMCLLLAAALGPSFWSYAQFVLAVQIVGPHRRENHVAVALDTIRSFVMPTSAAVVTAVTPHAAVSRAVSELVVGPYLPQAAVMMDGLSSQDCRSLRRALYD